MFVDVTGRRTEDTRHLADIGAVNLVLMGMNIRDGIRMSGRLGGARVRRYASERKSRAWPRRRQGLPPSVIYGEA